MSPDDPTRSVPPDRTSDHVEQTGDTTIGPIHPTNAPLPTVAGYIIERELGRGGMAVVYLAHQPGLNRSVAVKRIGGDGPPDDRAVIRFLAEAENVAAIRHPHVVQVHQFGRDDAGRPFLAMEYVPGGTLADLLRTAGKLPPRTAAELLAAVSEGVAAAHALGIVHRDLKPANVLLDNAECGIRNAESKPETGSAAFDSAFRIPHSAFLPKVSDFGLAKRGPGAELTNTHAIMGTPAYMCPEQAGGRTKFVGPPADVWAVGVMLYECLAGRRPFDADKSWDIIVQVVNAAPAPLRSVCPDVPRDLELIVGKCLAKEPADRYPSAAELAADLRAWLSGRPIAARPLPAWERGWRWAKRNQLTAGALAAAVFLLVAGTGVSVWQMLRANGEAQRADARAADAEREQKRAETGEAAAKASALEARRMVGRMAVAEGVRLADAGDSARALAWFARSVEVVPEDAADDLAGDRLAGYRRYGQVRTLVGLDGADWDLGEDGMRHGTREIRVENDDKKEVWTARVWDSATGQPVTPPLEHAGDILSTAFRPDGRRLATASHDRTARVWDAATGRPVDPLLQHADSVYSVAFSPDGRRLVAASYDGIARVWDAAIGQPVSPPLVHAGAVHSAGASPNSRRLATSNSDQTTRVWDVATGQPVTPPLERAGVIHSATFSPDGRRLATASFDRSARVWDPATGQPVTPLLEHGGMILSVAFNPDGKRLATTNYDGTAGTARVWDAVTGQPVTPELDHAGAVWSATFSPDGKRLVTASGDKTARVWDAATGRPLTPPLAHAGAVRSATFSPDGRRVATTSEDRTARVWDAATGQPVTPRLPHPGLVRSGTFSPDGRRLLTTSFTGDVRIWELPTDTRPTADLIKLAHLYAGGRIDDAGGFVPLTADETKALFAELKAKYPADFTVTPAQAAAWHREQLEEAEKDRDWFAARFHLRVLLEKYAFGDVELAARLRATREPAPPPKPRPR